MATIELDDGTKIWYQITGDGPLLVLNHGYGSSHKNFKNIIPRLKEYFLCLTWDNRGHGNSDNIIKDTYEETAKIYSISQFADDCYELLTKLNFIDRTKKERFFMFGVSMGGMLSQKFAIKYEWTLKALGLGATAPSFDNSISNIQLTGKIPLTKNREKLNAELGFTKKFLKNYPEFINKKIEKNFFILNNKLVIMPENLFGSFNVEESLKKLLIPVIVLHGENDDIMSINRGKKFTKLIPNCEFHSFPKISHNINKEIPEIVANKLKDFFIKNI